MTIDERVESDIKLSDYSANHHAPIQVGTRKKVERIIATLLEGKEVNSNLEYTGYNLASSAYTALKNATGLSVREFQRKYEKEITEYKFRNIRHDFFDRESMDSMYILGIIYAGLEYISGDELTFNIKHRELPDIVAKKLGLENTNDFRYLLKSKKITDKLREYGLHKKDIVFPNMNPIYTRDFVRGFFDNRASISIKDNRNIVTFKEDKMFLKSLNEILQQYAGITKNYENARDLVYGHKDSIALFKFMYARWKYVEKKGIYLESKYKLFNPKYTGDGNSEKRFLLMQKRIFRSLPIVYEGKIATQIYRKLGFHNVGQYYEWFPKIIGESLSQFQEKNVDREYIRQNLPAYRHAARKVSRMILNLLDNKTVSEISPRHKKTPQNFISTFKLVTGLTPGEFKRMVGIN